MIQKLFTAQVHKISYILAQANMSYTQKHKEIPLISIRKYLERKWYLSRLLVIKKI